MQTVKLLYCLFSFIVDNFSLPFYRQWILDLDPLNPDPKHLFLQCDFRDAV
jgi:hypothetical protein